MTKKPSTTVLAALILGALIFGLGCGLIEGVLGRFTDESVQGMVEKLTEEGLPEAVELPLEGLPEELELPFEGLPEELEPPEELLPESFELPESFGAGEAAEWPDWAPDFLPVYAYGELVVTYSIPGHTDGSLIYANLQTDQDPFTAYVAELEQAGWVAEEGWDFPADAGQAIAMTRDGYWLQYAVVDDADGAAATLTLFTEGD